VRRRRLTCQLKDDAFAGGDKGAFLADAVERDGDFFRVAAGHAVCEDVHGVSLLAQVYHGLQDTYVGLLIVSVREKREREKVWEPRSR
jgi:hypothetical protein